MKIFVSVLMFAAAAFVGCKNDFTQGGTGVPAASDQLIVRAHFIGSDQLLKDPNGTQLKQVWDLRSSADFRSKALDQFARLPFLWLSNSIPRNSSDQSALFRALFNDALVHESFLEWRATPVVALAVRLPEARASAWEANLREAIGNWKLGAPVALNGTPAGWELSRPRTPTMRFVRAGGWVAVTIGHGAANLESNVLARLKSPTRAGGAWLEGDANLAEFKGRIPGLANFQTLPAAHFSLSNRADFVRTMVQFDFPKPHNWKSEAWQIPTNLIWDPLADFTAARGISGVLDKLPFIGELGWKPTPSQITGWGSRDLPFQVFYAAPTRDVTNQLKKAEAKVRASLIRAGGTNLLGQIVWDTNRSQVAWRGLPLAAPTLTSLTNTHGQFVAIEFFPMIKTKQPPPPELFEQFFGRDDVVMYDWESTQYRIPTWRQMYQLAEIVTSRRLSATNAPGERWQTAVAPILKDSITELRVTSPTQMTLVRKSTIGLTAFELVTLSRWIESASFPAFGVFPPQQPRVSPSRGAAPPKNR